MAIKDFSFHPAEITISPGSTMVWSNDDSVAHTITGKGFDSGSIVPGASWSHTFEAAGEFPYTCSIHPYMTAVVKVR